MKRQVLVIFFILSLTTFSSITVSGSFPVNGSFLSLRSGIAESFDQFDNDVVLVEAFATWCEPCIKEMYEFSVLQDQFGDNLTIFSLSVSPGTDTLDKIEKFKQRAESDLDFTATWEFGLDHNGDFANYVNVSLIPTSYLIANGSVVKSWVGETTADEIGNYIDSNVTFPERSQFDILSRLILANNFFKGFVVFVVLILMYKVLIPRSDEEIEV